MNRIDQDLQILWPLIDEGEKSELLDVLIEKVNLKLKDTTIKLTRNDELVPKATPIKAPRAKKTKKVKKAKKVKKVIRVGDREFASFKAACDHFGVKLSHAYNAKRSGRSLEEIFGAGEVLNDRPKTIIRRPAAKGGDLGSKTERKFEIV